jgi:hypothetical protein
MRKLSRLKKKKKKLNSLNSLDLYMINMKIKAKVRILKRGKKISSEI